MFQCLLYRHLLKLLQRQLAEGAARRGQPDVPDLALGAAVQLLRSCSVLATSAGCDIGATCE